MSVASCVLLSVGPWGISHVFSITITTPAASASALKNCFDTVYLDATLESRVKLNPLIKAVSFRRENHADPDLKFSPFWAKPYWAVLLLRAVYLILWHLPRAVRIILFWCGSLGATAL
jgi:hypothetical protein